MRRFLQMGTEAGISGGRRMMRVSVRTFNLPGVEFLQFDSVGKLTLRTR